MCDKERMKRSVRIAGHNTSVSLEPEYWDELATFAAQDRVTLADIVARVDLNRKGNLSSALRLYVLKRLKDRK